MSRFSALGSGLLPWAVALAHVSLYGYGYLDLAGFNGDLERDLRASLDLVTGQGLSLAGPLIAFTDVTLGPLSTLLYAVPLLLSTDALFVHLVVVALGGLAVALAYRVVEAETSPPIALLATVSLIGSGMWFQTQFHAWHPALIPPFLFGFYRCAQRLLAGGPAWLLPLATALALITPQLHVVMAPIPVLALALIVATARRVGLRWLLASAVVGLVVLSPFVAGLFHPLVTDAGMAGGLASFANVPLTGFTELVGFFVWSILPGWELFPPRETLAGALTAPVGVVLLALVAFGVYLSVARGAGLTFRRLMMLNLLLGLPLAGRMLSYQLAARYPLVTALPLLLAAACALQALSRTESTRRWVGRGAVTIAAIVLALGAARTRLWHPHRGDPCGLLAQRATASAVREHAGLARADVPSRVHGLACRHEYSGYGWFYSAELDLERAKEARRKNLHVAFLPPGRRLEGHVVHGTYPVDRAGVSLEAHVFEASIDVRRLQIESQADGFLVRVAVERPLPRVRALVSFRAPKGVGGPPRQCAIAARWPDGTHSVGKETPLVGDYRAVKATFELEGRTGLLDLHIAQCGAIHYVDVF